MSRETKLAFLMMVADFTLLTIIIIMLQYKGMI